MLDPRVYRAALLPVLLVLIVVAFSLEDRPGPLRSSLASDAFDGARAAQLLEDLARRYPARRAGSPGDDGLAGAVATELRAALGRRIAVRTHSFAGETLDGDSDLLTVTAQAPGSTPRSQIVLVAARDAAEVGDRADLSGTAALLEVARVVAASHLQRTVTFASVSGGSGGEAGMRDLVQRIARPVDAVIEIGDLGGESSDRSQIVGWSGSGNTASIRLQRTVSLAVRREAGQAPGFPLARTQLARLALPLSVSGQGVALDAGIPSVRLARSGELPADDGTPVSAQRLGEYGQAVVGVLSALDGPLGAGSPTSDLAVSKKILPAWAMRLLAAALLLPAGLTIIDGLLRERRRGGRLLAHLVWVLALAVPFAAAALLARALGLAGAVPDLAPPAPPGAVPVDAAAWTALGCVLAALVLVAMVVTPWLTRRARVKGTDGSSGLALLLAVLVLAVVTWISNPYAALLLVLPLNFWLLVAERDTRLRRGLALALVAVSLAPVVLVAAVYASDLSMSLVEIPWFWLLAVAGGQITIPAAMCWSLGAGAATGAVLLALRPAHDRERPVTVRGPLSYAGPGSLGGTESAMRR